LFQLTLRLCSKALAQCAASALQVGAGNTRQKISGVMYQQFRISSNVTTGKASHHIRTAPYSAHYYRIAIPEPDPPPQEKFRQRMKFDRYLYERKEK
jgi:hypothetical protein